MTAAHNAETVAPKQRCYVHTFVTIDVCGCPPDPSLRPADTSELRQAISAVLHGAVWYGFDGPTGVSKDEALEYAAVLARWAEAHLDGNVEEM